MHQTLTVWMDDREPAHAVSRELTALGVSTEVRRLAIGDYQVEGRLLFERKTLRDFAMSVIDGRLFTQMARLAASPLTGVLILEGGSSDLKPTAIRREALQGALITTSLIYRIPVLRSLDPAETARLLVYSARQQAAAASDGIQRCGYRPRGRRKRQLFVLQGLPGVGPVLAARLLDRFGSVQKTINAGPEELASVDGIGLERAERIKWAVGESVPRYKATFHRTDRELFSWPHCDGLITIPFKDKQKEGK